MRAQTQVEPGRKARTMLAVPRPVKPRRIVVGGVPNVPRGGCGIGGAPTIPDAAGIVWPPPKPCRAWLPLQPIAFIDRAFRRVFKLGGDTAPEGNLATT